MANDRRQFLRSGAGMCLALSASAQSDGGGATPVRPVRMDALDSEKFRAAVLAGDVAGAAQFLDRDPALLYARDARGNSVYTLACLSGKKAMAEALAARGLELDIFEAAAGGNLPRATDLLKNAPGLVHARSVDGRTPLHFAAATGQPDIIMLLNSKGADLSAGPESPMLAVADYPDAAIAEEMARTLAGNASDPNARRQDGKTALHLAAARGNADVVRMLIHRGAHLDARDADGRTPSDVAAGEAVKVLRDADSIDRVYYAARYERDLHGSAVTRDDTNGLPHELINQFITFAHFDFDQVKRLYKLCPALLTTRATWDELAVEAAAHMGRVDMASYLADLGSPVSTCTAVMLGLTDRVRDAVRRDPDCMRERGAHDLPLLAYTAFGDQRVDLADFLLASGADANIRAFGQTTLHIAAAKGHTELAALLLDRGADVNALAKSRAGRATPLDVAQRAKKIQVTALLERRGGRTAVLP